MVVYQIIVHIQYIPTSKEIYYAIINLYEIMSHTSSWGMRYMYCIHKSWHIVIQFYHVHPSYTQPIRPCAF